MSAVKRKAGTTIDERPRKKKTTEETEGLVSVQHIDGAELAKPVIAFSPGVSIPRGLKFHSFARKSANGQSEVLLHSTTHPTIDFTAKEGVSYAERHLKHYIAVYDPVKGKLQVTEAAKLTVRSSLRQRALEPKDDEEDDMTGPVTNYLSRAALTQTFGTKKSKKAVQSIAENRLLARGGDDESNPLTRAMLSTMPETEDPMEYKEIAQANKPLPVPNLKTNNITKVYPLTSLVFPHPPAATLEQMPIAHWQASYRENKAVIVSSRYVSQRVGYLAKAIVNHPDDVDLRQTMQLLRYLYVLLEVYQYLQARPAHKRIPPVARWPTDTVTGNLGLDLMTAIIEHFSPGFQAKTKNSTTLLQSTILALTLHIPPPSLTYGANNVLVTEPTDIQLDLGLEPADCRKLYRELGCKVSVSASEADLAVWGLQKVWKKREREEREKAGDGKAAVLPKPKFVKLTFPIQFPVVSLGRQRDGRR